MESINSKSLTEGLTNLNKGSFFVAKRIFDIILASLALVLLFPVVIIVAICVFVESPGNPFYIQKRMGLMGKEFSLIKLRSMKLDAEADGPQWADEEDNRVTKVGKVIRKTRLDELPQFWNVLIGDMSIIGPRPERKVFVEDFVKDIPDFPKRLQIRPGLTGWAQVNGGYDISPKEKLNLDLQYINDHGFLVDLKIILKTIKIVFTGEGAR